MRIAFLHCFWKSIYRTKINVSTIYNFLLLLTKKKKKAHDKIFTIVIGTLMKYKNLITIHLIVRVFSSHGRNWSLEPNKKEKKKKTFLPSCFVTFSAPWINVFLSRGWIYLSEGYHGVEAEPYNQGSDTENHQKSCY